MHLNFPMVYLRANFLMAVFSTVGSLYYSEIMKFPPCTLCWYQRICIYPLVIIFGAALLTDDHKHLKYSLPLLLTGLAFAVYHNLLYFGVIAQELIPCTGSVSCSTRQLELLGFITIPLMAMVGLVVMIVLAFLEFRFASSMRSAQ